MIGYYVHHLGRGHLTRAGAIARALKSDVTALSSLPRPTDWMGDWVSLASDVEDVPVDAGAGGSLHWVPLHGDGLRERMAAIGRWIAAARPDAFVVDVSVEVALLARVHGVPVITIALPGDRGDRAHALGYDLSAAIVAAWPPEARGMIEGLSAAASGRVHTVGAISRPRASAPQPRRGETRLRRHAVVLAGTGGDDFTSATVARAQARTPGWTWTRLGGSTGAWSDDPAEHLLFADVVVTHAGEGSLAEVSAARLPAIVLPQSRPHDEQATTARALDRSRWPVLVRRTDEVTDWGALLDEAAALDGDAWATWNDGDGAARAAAVIESVIRDHGSPR